MTNSQAQASIERLFPYASNIGHDDPDADQLLNDKLETLKAKQECFKAINKIVKNSKYEDSEKITHITKVKEGITEEIAQGLLQPDFMGRTGFPEYMLRNNVGGMKAVKDRLSKIQRVSNMEDFSEKRNGVEIEINRDLNRITVDFDKQPSKAVCAHLKSNGYRWAPSKNMWLGNIARHRLEQAKLVWDMVEPVMPVRATANSNM